MTREEAIKHGKEQLEIFGGTHREFIEMSIKALEQESTTKNCESCRYYGSHNKVCNYCYKCSLWTEKGSTTKNDLGVDREDAVERLNALKQFIGYDEDSEIVKATQKSIDMAISALEHPERNVVAVVPCGDTISRQAVIDLMMQKWGENFSGDDAMQESIDAIRVLPSVTPQEPRWIPVSERMPEDGQFVLFCDIDDDSMVGYHVKGRPNTHFLQVGIFEDMKNVRAWMPLPKPYEPQGSEE